MSPLTHIAPPPPFGLAFSPPVTKASVDKLCAFKFVHVELAGRGLSVGSAPPKWTEQGGLRLEAILANASYPRGKKVLCVLVVVVRLVAVPFVQES